MNDQNPRPRLGRNVISLGAVSFLTDVSSEMIYPLLPVFLTTVLGADAAFVGAIEGAVGDSRIGAGRRAREHPYQSPRVGDSRKW